MLINNAGELMDKKWYKVSQENSIETRPTTTIKTLLNTMVEILRLQLFSVCIWPMLCFLIGVTVHNLSVLSALVLQELDWDDKQLMRSFLETHLISVSSVFVFGKLFGIYSSVGDKW